MVYIYIWEFSKQTVWFLIEKKNKFLFRIFTKAEAVT